VGVEVAFADLGGWDHHFQEPNQLPPRLAEFGASLAADVLLHGGEFFSTEAAPQLR